MTTPLARDLDRLRRVAEEGARPGRFAQRLHLMPPVGWLNDPNGLCQYHGAYHAFFQYAPFSADGSGVKMWGHSASRDLLSWDYLGVAVFPDQPFDVTGAYSGCALVEGDDMEVFYTGNVKLVDDGSHDYVTSGREANTVRATCADGVTLSRRHVVMRNADYPADDTEHVRDPKVWRRGDSYLMVQGARRTDDVGEVLVFSSPDLERWRLVNRVTTERPFGYMWECPDYLELADPARPGGVARLLSVSPQGLSGGDWDRRNVYQSGFFELAGDVASSCTLGDFALWDAGFDFYAPQTFLADDGRRILVGWMGVPDEEGYVNPTVADGWQHCLTLPREVTSEGGRVRQRPVRELRALRRGLREASGSLEAPLAGCCFDLEVDRPEGAGGRACVTIADELSVRWEDGTLSMRFSDPSRGSVGAGRTLRYEPLASLSGLRLVGDASSVEVFANDGGLCLSTRYYPRRYGVCVDAPGARVRLWDLAR